MDIFLYIPLENPCTGWFVEAGGLQNVGGIDPVVLAAAHDMLFEVGTELVFVDGDLEMGGLARKKSASWTRMRTPLYVALYIPVLGWSAAILSASGSRHRGWVEGRGLRTERVRIEMGPTSGQVDRSKRSELFGRRLDGSR